MTRGTTPTIVLKLKTELQMKEMKQIWVTLQNLVYEKTFTKETLQILTDNSIAIQLSQEDTLKFVEGTIEVQVRILTMSDKAYATNIKTLSIKKILKEGVIV